MKPVVPGSDSYLPPLPEGADPTRLKFFSTHLCSCIEDDGSEAELCHNFCWRWERLDLEETLKDWYWGCAADFFGIRNAIALRDSGVFVRQSGEALTQGPASLIDILVYNGGDFTMYYETPQGGEWRFYQYSPDENRAEGDEWVLVTVFPLISRFDDGDLDEAIEMLEQVIAETPDHVDSDPHD